MHWTGTWKTNNQSPTASQSFCVHSVHNPIQEYNQLPNGQPKWNLAAYTQVPEILPHPTVPTSSETFVFSPVKFLRCPITYFLSPLWLVHPGCSVANLTFGLMNCASLPFEGTSLTGDFTWSRLTAQNLQQRQACTLTCVLLLGCFWCQQCSPCMKYLCIINPSSTGH